MKAIGTIAILLICTGIGGMILPMVSRRPQVNEFIDPYATQLVNDHITLGAFMLTALPFVLILAFVVKLVKKM